MPQDPRKTRRATKKRATKASASSRRKPKAAREPDFIEVRGAEEHNLQIDGLKIPKRELVVFTGVSGSGKSSLAFDTLYAEGQRRYIESLSAYARQFLGQLERPKVEYLSGLSPTIAIEQKSASANPRSTVGTITEIYDYLRVLYARAGRQHCHECGKAVKSQTTEQIVAELFELPADTKLTLLAPLITHRKGEFRDLFEELAGRGYIRVRVDGEIHRVEDPPKLDKKFKHTIELVVDRVKLRRGDRRRITESVELALREGKGELIAEPVERGKPIVFSQERSCCGHSFPELSPQSFSFNSPLGCCQACNGLGTRMEVDPELVVPDKKLSINDGAIAPWASAVERESGWTYRIIEAHLARPVMSTSTRPLEQAGQAQAAARSSTASRASACKVDLGRRGRRQPRYLGRALRRGHPQSGAPLFADLFAMRMRGSTMGKLLSRGALRGVRRQASAAGEPRGARRQARHRRGHRA